MVAYQPDSPSRMCDGALDEAARMLDTPHVSHYGICDLPLVRRTSTNARQASIPTCVHTSTPLRASCGALS
jgi:hypothetical protein